MQEIEGQFAQAYNRRKKRSGSFWEGRYQCTMIEPGPYLWRCMVYIELNMVRAGVVRHPASGTVAVVQLSGMDGPASALPSDPPTSLSSDAGNS
jgi:hypothetical protein